MIRKVLILAVLLAPCVSLGGGMKPPPDAPSIFTLVEKGMCWVVGEIIPCNIPVERVAVVTMPNGKRKVIDLEEKSEQENGDNSDSTLPVPVIEL